METQGWAFQTFGHAKAFTSDSFLKLSDAEVTLLVIISFGLDSFQNGQADLSPVSHNTSGPQMSNVNSFAVPVIHADVDVGIATNNRTLNASQFDGPGEVPLLIHRLDSGGSNGVEVDPLQRTDPARDRSGVNLLLFWIWISSGKCLTPHPPFIILGFN